MFSLPLTTYKLQVVLAGAKTTNEVQCTVIFFDVQKSSKINSPIYPRYVKLIDTNGGTDVDICDAPPQDTIRHIETINIYNRDTVNAIVTIKYDVSATETILKKHTLTTGQTLIYENGAGWLVL